MPTATICELVLVAACGLSGKATRSLPGLTGFLAPCALFIVGLAAFVGALRFTGMESLAPAHITLSAIGGAWLAALGGCFVTLGRFRPSLGHPSFFLIALVGTSLTLSESSWPWRLPLSVAGLLLTVAGSLSMRSIAPKVAAAGIVAALSLVIAGVGIGSQGSIGGYARLDLFHLALAGSVSLHAYALVLLSRQAD